jgi:hypothetical protein
VARTKKQEHPIIRLTRFEIQITVPKKEDKESTKETIHTFYGVDAEGNERVYAQLSDEQFKKWSKKDSLWLQAQSAMFHRLLSKPKTRDSLIRINLKAALENGDEKMAAKLWDALSESAKAELMPKPEV